ncbi:MAG: threonine ammonia-lyase [Actinomycetota bacterium]
MDRPAFVDVLSAARTIRPYVTPTAFYESISLGRMLGLRLFIKYENHQPVGSFKLRGALNRMLSASNEERSRGFVTASQGNHGQGVCYAARIVGAKATVVVPEKGNPDKVEAMRNLGAEVITFGSDFEAAVAKAWEIAAERNATYLHAAGDPLIVAGHATVALEMFAHEPALDTIVFPIGAGGLISGSALVAKTLKPEVEVIGVQAEKTPGFVESLEAGHVVECVPNSTFAEGIAVRQPPELTFEMVRDLVDKVITVTEEEMRRAILLLLEKTHNLAEGAGAAGLAGVVKLREDLAGRTVGTVLSGGNLPWHVLNRALNDIHSW